MLAELKIISGCPTRYPRNPCPIQKASTLPKEYRQHNKKVDQEYGGFPQDQVACFPTMMGLRRMGRVGERFGDVWSKTSATTEGEVAVKKEK